MEDPETDSGTDEEDLMTELDRYLKTSRVKKVKDPLQWWKDNEASYPRLSRMARDYLVIPGKFY
jgi:hAT family protein